MKKLLCFLVFAALLLSLTACSLELPTKGAEEESTRDRAKNRTTEATTGSGQTSMPEQVNAAESTKNSPALPTKTSAPAEAAAETLPEASETAAVPETPAAIETTAAEETPAPIETSAVPETPAAIETTIAEETTEVIPTTEKPDITVPPVTAESTVQPPETPAETEAPTEPATTEPETTVPEPTEPVVILNPGDRITFGRYEQDGIPSNGREEVTWIVLHIEGNKALLLSRFCLDCKKAHEKDMNITWEGSDLRKWLNSSFLNETFTTSERAHILSVPLENKANPKSGFGAAPETTDTVFLLSVEEVERYLSGDMYEFRGTTPTRYAMDHGSMLADNGNTWWWLRTNGKDLRYFAEIYSYREFDYMGDLATDPEQAVRPAIWVDITGLEISV
ncbi:MAG: hypothetical protein J5496_02000 [Lachnospiraceae bacterium]|nr:hypothetical protein [Lachnospiraceae bacterium]